MGPCLAMPLANGHLSRSFIFWPIQQQQYTLVTDGKSVSCSAGVTQITVEIGGERFLVYLDSSKHKLLYNPIVYSTLEGVNSNFTSELHG